MYKRQARNHLNDSFLYVGKDKGESFISAARFDLTEVPRGADIAHAELRLTGLRDNRFNKDVAGTWIVQLLSLIHISLQTTIIDENGAVTTGKRPTKAAVELTSSVQPPNF